MGERGVPVVFRPENPRREEAPSGAPLTVYVPGNSLFHRMRNRAVSGASSLRGAIEQLRLRLPQAWRVVEAAQARQATIVIRAPDSRVAHLAVVARRRIEPKDIGGIVPIARPLTKHLRQVANDSSKIKEHHLRECQLPPTIGLGTSGIIASPYYSGKRLIRGG